MGATAGKFKYATMADAMARVGRDVPYDRVRADPAAGTVTAADLLDDRVTHGRPCEVVGGILVEKPMGWAESRLATLLSRLIGNFVDEHNLGVVAGADGGIRFKLDLVRMPDVSFVAWAAVDNPADLENPAGAFLELPPDLAVELVNPANTAGEMGRKLADYRAAGVELIWYVYPDRRQVEVFTAGGESLLTEGDTLDGGAVLPGFTLPVADIFRSRAPARRPGRKGRK